MARSRMPMWLRVPIALLLLTASVILLLPYVVVLAISLPIQLVEMLLRGAASGAASIATGLIAKVGTRP